MCSIFAILEIKQDIKGLRQQALVQSRLMRHRGPDWSGIWHNNQAILAHERLAIVGVDYGRQPLFNADETHVLAVNGEIYNHQQLRHSLSSHYDFQTASDCEIILALYADRSIEFLNDLSGMFAFVLYDVKRQRYLIARDPIGIIPLYYGYDQHQQLYVASEMKGLIGVCQSIYEFPAGHYWDSEEGEIKRYYERPWMTGYHTPQTHEDVPKLRQVFESAVVSHMMSDVPYAVLLSGGLDSSLVSALAIKHSKMRVENKEMTGAWWPQLHSFAVGLEGAPDLQAARQVAEAIGTVHHAVHFTIQEGIDALSDVIYHIETYDVTSIRASVPMFLLARHIKSMGIKMVLSGEGSDELFGGYLYFHKAPSAQALHEECVRKLERLHAYDCLRANKSMAAWGIETRVPFLDPAMIDCAMQLNPELKMCRDGRIEKQVLRDAFKGLLPDNILYRQKEQFSDGVGYSWIDSLQEHAENIVKDAIFDRAAQRFPIHTPATKEAYLYRDIFEKHFPLASAALCVPDVPSVACSTEAALEWDKSFRGHADPSGRAVSDVHKKGL